MKVHRRIKQSTIMAISVSAIFLFMIGSIVALTRQRTTDNPPSGGSTTIIPKPTITPQPIVCTSFFPCTVMREIQNTHQFLVAHKNGQPYTPDPRTLTQSFPYTELVRLNIVPQIQGYANLYTLTNDQTYAQEARSRLDYVISLGSQALANNPWDGNVGYVFLDAYQRIGGDAYRQYGLAIADACLTYTGQNGWGSDNILNWGYMCGMVDAKAYVITGAQKYLDEVRRITRRTGPEQNTDGGFPHLPHGLTDTGYTTWMMEELLSIRRDDPQNPDTDVQLEKAEQMLLNRVNEDGSMNYSDANGNYANNPGGYDTRGWTSGLSGLAYYLKSTGHTDEAQRLLAYLFTKEGTGDTLGAYPDKWGYFQPEDPWSSGNPSVLRTSDVFDELTLIALEGRGGACTSGTSNPCTMTPSNCNAAFAEFNLCSSNIQGSDRCINGQWTKCLNPDVVKYKLIDCAAPECSLQPGGLCWKICTVQGPQLCVGQSCGQCIEPYNNMTKCTETCGIDVIPEQCLE